MSYGYGPARTTRDDDESAHVVRRAVELGINLFDTADVYGPYSNERLVGRALGRHRREVAISTKCGLVPRPDGGFGHNGRPGHLRAACEGSLRRLRVETIDLYQLHHVDPGVPLAESWGALADLVQEGKVRALGVSHVTLDELAEIHAIHPVSAVQYELSVWARRHLYDVLPWTRCHDVTFLAFCPIGRGYLSGRVDPAGLVPEDSRRRDPRFVADANDGNQMVVEGLRRIAARHGASPAQVAIAWTLTCGEHVIPIPGTRHLRWLEENAAATALQLTEEDLREIDALPPASREKTWDPRLSAALSHR